MMAPPDRRYIARVARQAGVPEMVVEDCVQEISIALWLAPDAPAKMLIRRRAIDFVRHWCGGYRSLTRRPEMISIEKQRDRTLVTTSGPYSMSLQDASYTEPAVPVDATEYVDDFDQIRRNLPKLSPSQRAALEMALSGRYPTPEKRDVHYKHLSDARKRLRVA